MNRIGRVRRFLAWPSPLPAQSSRPHACTQGQEVHLAGRPGHRARPRGRRWATLPPSPVPSARSAGQNWPAATTTMSWRRTVTALGLLPHTVQLCIHCRQSPAGFWVSRHGGQTVRRPWCLPCCQELDPGRYDVIRFDS